MDIQYRKEYSVQLGRDMEYKIYGWGGVPCIWFPCQNGRFFDFENYGMLDVCRTYLDQGRMQLFTVDSMDAESLSAVWRPGWERMDRQEQYFRYISDELSHRIFEINSRAWDTGIMVMGFSLGAYHSANFYFRRPDLFTRNLSLSGAYSIKYMVEGYESLETYLNSPVDSLRNLPEGHPYFELLRRNRAVFCTGQGAWEHPMQESTRELDTVMCEKHLPAKFCYWGYDVYHDWCWWKRQLEVYLPWLLD